VEEQGGSAVAPPEGPLPCGGGPAPQEAADAFFRRRLLIHRRSFAPPLSRFPQGFLALFFRFLSQRRFGFYLHFCVSKVLLVFKCYKLALSSSSSSSSSSFLTYCHILWNHGCMCLCLFKDRERYYQRIIWMLLFLFVL
jgi:hypothetical protein